MIVAALAYCLAALCLLWLGSRHLLHISWSARIVLLLLPLCFTGKALLTPAVYAPIDLPFQAQPLAALRPVHGIGSPHNPMLSDLAAQIIPWRTVVREAYRGGEWPLWNPYEFAGGVLAAASQSAPYNPLLVASFALPLPDALDWHASMIFFLAALTAFLFFRQLGCSEPASLFGAASWAFSNFIVFWLAWPLGETVAYLPLLLYAIRRLVDVPDGHSMWILVAAFTLLLLAGHPESVLHLVAFGAAYALFELTQRRPVFLRATARAVTAGVIALLLSAIYLLPIFEALPQTFEHSYREAVYAHQERSVAAPELIARLKMSVIPFRFGYPDEHTRTRDLPGYPVPVSAYCGSIIFATAAFALWRSDQRLKWFFAAAAIAGLLLGNDAPPFADWIAQLPLFDIAINQRLIFVAAFALSALAAFGLDAWLRETSRRRVATVFLLVTIVSSAVLAHEWSDMHREGLPGWFVQKHSAAFLAPLIALAATAMFIRNMKLAAAMALALLLGQRVAEFGDAYPTLPGRAFYPAIPGLQLLPREGEPYRIVGVGNMLTPATATMYRLEDVRGYQALNYAAFLGTYALWATPQPVWFNRVDDLTRPFLSLLNVRYAVAPPDFIPPRGWTIRARTAGMTLLQNDGWLQRAFLPAQVSINDPAAGLWIGTARNFGERAWIERPWRRDLTGTGENGRGSLRVRRKGLNALRIDAEMESAGYAVISQSAWKGWRAAVDGKPVPLFRANSVFLAIEIPAGRHTVELRYLPRSFVLGATIAALTLLAILVAAIIARRRRSPLV